MSKQLTAFNTAHKIRNHLTIVQNEVVLANPKTLELSKKVVVNELKIIKSLLLKLDVS